jgi:dimethylargininase
MNPEWIDVSAFTDCRVISVCEEEPWAASTLTVDDVVLMPEGFPKTRFVLEQNGFCVHTVDISELLKAEGSVSCLTNLIDADIVVSE